MKITDLIKNLNETIEIGDHFDIELDDLIIEPVVVDIVNDGIVIAADDVALSYLQLKENGQFNEAEYKVGDTVSYKHDGIETHGFKITAIRGDNLELHKKPFDPAEPEIRTTAHISKVWVDEGERVEEAKYQGREVPLGKPMAGDVKKRKVYVKKPNGKVVKVNFGDKKMRIKKSNPKRRKSFRARHNCKNPGPRWKARFWSCRAW